MNGAIIGRLTPIGGKSIYAWATAFEAAFRALFTPFFFLDTRPAIARIRFRSSRSIFESSGTNFFISDFPERDDSKESSVPFADFGTGGGWSPSNIIWYSGISKAPANFSRVSTEEIGRASCRERV